MSHSGHSSLHSDEMLQKEIKDDLFGDSQFVGSAKDREALPTRHFAISKDMHSSQFKRNHSSEDLNSLSLL